MSMPRRADSEIRVSYYYSACVGLVTPDTSILCDPWFTDGIYDGSWYTFPKMFDPVRTVGFYENIWISHIHPDHYDKEFLRAYLQAYPETRLYISHFNTNYLQKVMERDGFRPIVTNHMKFGETLCDAFPSEASYTDVDSALTVRWRDHAIVNMNDCLWNDDQLAKIRDCVGRPQIALLGYTGAGPWPQTYYERSEITSKMLEDRKTTTLQRYMRMASFFEAAANIPFAGQYILGGKLTGLNEIRGVMDAVEVAEIDPRAVVLADGGSGEIGTKDLKASSIRREKYRKEELERRYDEISSVPMLYERELASLPVDRLRLPPLLVAAARNAVAKSRYGDDFYFVIRFGGERNFVFNVNANKQEYFFGGESDVTPRSEITIDPKYLFGLLTGLYHWDNANIGSQFRTRRFPDVDIKAARATLAFFHV